MRHASKRYDEKVLTAAREKVRGALGIYKSELELALDKVPRGSGHADNDFDHLKASITEVKSAKRVLHMED